MPTSPASEAISAKLPVSSPPLGCQEKAEAIDGDCLERIKQNRMTHKQRRMIAGKNK